MSFEDYKQGSFDCLAYRCLFYLQLIAQSKKEFKDILVQRIIGTLEIGQNWQLILSKFLDQNADSCPEMRSKMMQDDVLSAL